ncbi:hypothetical protein BDB00DRAFT_799580 [Zychaea mexicana]|uniref:uncharacterized protein n=1 Tax=Zychaea mexicana TaxID=64656 RepID=UPI0022FE2477|nr:uncharacterized protein BDB00DRAFT_799580 [Zychaea mexicana]KAI9498804.1 hypothetical protein BDB00DRAFT_799580 [Zychaea mexicana]
MDFSPEETETLRKRLLIVLEPFTEADPEALLDFILLFINKGSSRDDLLTTYKNELSVFCEENTDKAVEAVFNVIDGIIAARDNTSSSTAQKTPAAVATTLKNDVDEIVTGRKREKEESDDEEDDDRNFKRRNVNVEEETVVNDISHAATTDITSATTSKRKNPEDSHTNEEERPTKLSRSPEQERVFSTLPEHLRKRLGNRAEIPNQQQEPRIRQPCRHFEERGFCLFGDSCRYDHGQNVAVADYSNFQAMFSTPGSAPMSNPMMMNMSGQVTPYNMTTTPYEFKNPADMAETPKQPQHQNQQPQPQQRHHQQQSYQEVPYTTRYNKNSTRLVIEKIPTEACTIDSVTETFKRFGTIVDIELQPENQRAFLEFKTHDEALKAHQSPEVLFNNRFVKVFWRKESQQQQQQYKQQEQQQQHAEPDPELVKKRAAELAKIREEQQRRKKEQLEKQIEYNKKKQEIARRNLELAMLKAKVAAMEAKKQGGPTAAEEGQGSATNVDTE